MKKIEYAGRILATIVLLVVGNGAGFSQSEGKRDVDFQILTDRTTYTPGARMHVKFIVTNTGEAPLYFFRDMSKCSSPIGSFFLLILDENGRQANQSGCSSDYVMEKVDVSAALISPESGMKLRTAEIWGFDGTFDLPATTGVYRLEAELVPAGLTREQRTILSHKNIRVLREHCAAPLVAITVK